MDKFLAKMVRCFTFNFIFKGIDCYITLLYMNVMDKTLIT